MRKDLKLTQLIEGTSSWVQQCCSANFRLRTVSSSSWSNRLEFFSSWIKSH